MIGTQIADTITLIEVTHDKTYNLIGRDIMSDGSVSVLKSCFGNFKDPIDALIHQQIMNNPLLLVESSKWTPEKWEDVKTNVRAQLNADTDAAKKLRASLGL